MAANIGRMDSPRSGFRRAAAASWTLAGLGVAGVAGASTLAYADTFKPPAADAPGYVVEAPPAIDPPAASVPNLPPPEVVTPTIDAPPEVVTPTIDAPPPPPSVAEPAPIREFTPTVEPAAPATTHPAPPPAPPRPTTSRRLTSVSVMPPKAVPRVTASHGS